MTTVRTVVDLGDGAMERTKEVNSLADVSKLVSEYAANLLYNLPEFRESYQTGLISVNVAIKERN